MKSNSDSGLALPDNRAYCGLSRRLAAMLYDALLLIALWMLATALIVIVSGQEIPAQNRLFMLYLIIISWAYFAICWRGGHTLGMKAWRIRILARQQPMAWSATLLRFLVACLGMACGGLGFLWSLFNPQRAGWHDLASASRLVVVPRAPSKPAQQDKTQQKKSSSRQQG